MKGFLRFLFNFFWVILIGIESAITNFFLGIAFCLTIIGIPFGLQYFKFIRLAFAPAGKKVVIRFSRHPVMNVLWLIFGGLEMAIIYYVLGIALCITIIGIPVGLQIFKIANFNIAPFGCEVLKDGEYSSLRDTSYDYQLLVSRINANPKVVIGTKENGEEKTVADYIRENQDEIAQIVANKRKKDKIWNIVQIIGIALIIFMPSGMFNNASDIVVTIASIVCGLTLISLGAYFLETNKKAERFFNDKMKFLMDYYPMGSPSVKVKKIMDGIVKYIDITLIDNYMGKAPIQQPASEVPPQPEKAEQEEKKDQVL